MDSESGGLCFRLGFAVLCKDPWPSDLSSLGLSFPLCKMRPELYYLPYFITGLFWEPNEGACDKFTVMYKWMPWLWWHLVHDGSCPDLWTGQICTWNCSVIDWVVCWFGNYNLNRFQKIRKDIARGFISVPKYPSKINNPKNIRMLVLEGPLKIILPSLF